MESAEMNALEQYTEDERFPEWNDEAEYLFRTEYISKIKPLAEEWEAGIMYHAKLVDEYEKESLAFGDETATEYLHRLFQQILGQRIGVKRDSGQFVHHPCIILSSVGFCNQIVI